MKIKVCDNEFDKEKLIKEQKDHHQAADSAYKSKAKDKELAKSDPSVKCYVFDLQQCLPTPNLNTSVAFYKRLYWTYNLTVHDCGTKEATHYIWHEAVGERGANEIASCLYKHLKDHLPNTIKTIILYSDTCAGQNKNSIVAAMFTYLMQKKTTLKEVHHKFLIPGHTHLECDSDHSVIER